MSRVSSRNAATNATVPATNDQSSSKKYTNIGPILGLLSTFIQNKQKQSISAFMKRAKQYASFSKKRQGLLGALLTSLFNRKVKAYTKAAIKSMSANRIAQIKQEVDKVNAKKKVFRAKSAAILGIVFNKIYQQKLKANFELLATQTKLKNKYENLRSRHIIRIFNIITQRKLTAVFRSLKLSKLNFTKTKSSFASMQKLFSSKKRSYLLFAILKLQAYDSNESQQQVKPAEVSRGSRVRSVTAQRITSPQPETVAPAEDNTQKKRELETKNKKIEQEIKVLKDQNEKILNKYRRQISQLQEQHDRLRFNSGILDKAIEDLEIQIVNRQKRTRKILTNAELWDRIYSNFLLLLKEKYAETLPKERILQYLMTPLAPLNLDIDALKTENQLLVELLEQYRIFYQGKQILEVVDETTLPYDIIMTKNKFIYQALEALIRQGVGTEEEIRQLEVDLEGVAKQQ